MENVSILPDAWTDGASGMPSRGRQGVVASESSPLATHADNSIEPKQRKDAYTVALIEKRSLIRDSLSNFLGQADEFDLMALSSPAELTQREERRGDAIDVILLSIGSALVSDFEVQSDLKMLAEVFPTSPIVIICDHDDSVHIAQTIQEGLRGYIPTTLAIGVFVHAVKLVLAGGTFIPSEALKTALAMRHSAPAEVKAPINPSILRDFTPRQQQVLDLLRRGKPNKIIAYELDMRESTVKVHVRNIMRQLHATNRTQAAFLASSLLGGDPTT